MQEFETMNYIGKIIRSYRIKNKMTQEDLSELAGCSCGFIGQIERGESLVSIPVLYKIIHALNIDANELFWDSNNTNSEEQQLNNQIQLRINQLNSAEKQLVLSLVNNLINLK